MSNEEYILYAFKCEPVQEGNYRNIKLIRVKDIHKANLLVTGNGEIQPFLGGNKVAAFTNPFLVTEKSTYSKQLWMKSEGMIYSIDAHMILRYAFPDNYREMLEYQKLFKSYTKMRERLSENKKSGWKI